MLNRSRKTHKGGMPLSYLRTNYMEPSARSGADVLMAQPGLGRPVLNATGGSRHRRSHRRSHSHKKRCGCKKGGFFSPSIMGSFLRNAKSLMPLAAYSGYKLLNRKTRRNRK